MTVLFGNSSQLFCLSFRPAFKKPNPSTKAAQSKPKMSETLTDRPSSRVLAAPGGASSMAGIFGGGDVSAPPPSQRGVAKATVPEGAAGQRIAVRNEHTGISEIASSRVLAAPGGASSMSRIFGGDAPTAPAPAPRAAPVPVATAAPEGQLAAGQRVAHRARRPGIRMLGCPVTSRADVLMR